MQDGNNRPDAQREAQSIDFSTFVLSMASSAMIQLGRVPDPTGEGLGPNLAVARQTIDVLAMLAEKTHGNLSRAEQTLVQRLLHDLRIAWVESSRRSAS